jgi:hypothetical protein
MINKILFCFKGRIICKVLNWGANIILFVDYKKLEKLELLQQKVFKKKEKSGQFF